MPKIRDLGINVIPEMTRPPEIGPGGGCGPSYQCGACTQQTNALTCTATDCSYYNYMGCTDASRVNSANCCPTPSDMYMNFFAAGTCGATRVTCSADWAGCGRSYGQCWGGSHCGQSVPDCTPSPKQPSDGCWPQGTGGGLTREAISQLKAQLQQKIEQLDEYVKSIGPKTVEEIEAREKELKAELEELAQRRRDLGK